MLRRRWCHIIVLNVHTQTDDKKIDKVIDKIPKYHMNILLEEFCVKVGRKDIFELRIANESLYGIRNDSGDKVVNFSTSKNLGDKSTMFPHSNIHKYFPDWKSHNQIYHILIDRQSYSSVLDVCIRL
jgi:hypothetical protein